jgi:hypothetical protein
MERSITKLDFIIEKHGNFFKWVNSELGYIIKMYPKFEQHIKILENNAYTFMSLFQNTNSSNIDIISDEFCKTFDIDIHKINKDHLKKLKSYLSMFMELSYHC